MLEFIIKIKKIPLRQEFRKPLFGLAVLSAIVLCFFTARLTYSAITDSEKSLGNIFGAGNLDITLSTPDFSPDVTPDDESITNFEINDNTSIIFKYIISFKLDDTPESLCDELKLIAYLGKDQAKKYEGDLKDFTFPASDTDPLEWKFEVSIDDDSTLENKECKFDIEVKAWQKEMTDYPEGYSDIETISATIKSGTWTLGAAAPLSASEIALPLESEAPALLDIVNEPEADEPPAPATDQEIPPEEIIP